MKYNKKCECCGHQITAYTISLNKSLVEAFIRFAQKFIDGGRKPITKPEIGLTNTQYTNFHNLVYFGIIYKAPDHDGWYLTDLGEKFYYCEESVLTPAGFMGGETLAWDHPAWATHDSPRHNVMISDISSVTYKKRPDYAREKSNQEPLFKVGGYL